MTILKRVAAACLGTGLCWAASAVNAEHLTAQMHEVDPGAASLGVALLRIAAVCLGVVFMCLAVTPARWFRHPGLEQSLTGLRTGPQGWHPENREILWLPLLIILCLGTLLRLYKLETGLWIDEILTLVKHARLSVWENLYIYRHANQHVLNSLLGHFSIVVFGEHIWSLRLPAVLFGIGGLWALYYFARVVTGEREALMATALMAVSYHHVWFSQNARGYTAMLFWALLGIAALLRAIAHNRTRDWVLYGASMLLGVWSVLNTAFIVASHIPAYLFACLYWRATPASHAPIIRKLLLTQFIVGIACVLLYSLALPSIFEYFVVDRAGPDAEAALTPDADKPSGNRYPYKFFSSLAAGLMTGLGPLWLLAAALALALSTLGFASYFRQSRLVAAIMILPPLLNTAAVAILNFPAFPRAFLYVMPFAILFIVRGASVLGDWVARRLSLNREAHGSGLAACLVGAMLAVSAITLQHNYRYPKQDYAAALAYVDERARVGDVICAPSSAGFVYREYYERDICFPESLPELLAARFGKNRIWVIYSLSQILRSRHPGIYTHVMENTAPAASFPGTLGDGDVQVRLGEITPD